MLNLSKLSRGAFALLVLSAVVFKVEPALAKVLKIELPLETAVFKTAPGSEMANAQCLTCHSVEYIGSQPPKPVDFWAAEIKKMREKYGAPIPKDYDGEIAGYLAKNYGVAPTNSAAVPSTNAGTVTDNMQPLSADAMATKYGCLSCHKVDVKVVGPAFKDVAAKYRNDADALEKIKQQIRDGGSGKWGSVVMPPYKTLVNDEQAGILGHWIMDRGAAK
jgi:cytochrome c